MNFVTVLAIFMGVIVKGISGLWLPLFSSTSVAETAKKATEELNSQNLEEVDHRGQEMMSSVPVVVMPQSDVFESVHPEEGAPEESFLVDSEPVALDYYMNETEEEEEMFPPELVVELPEHNIFQSIHPAMGSPIDPVVIEPEAPAVVGEVGHAFVAAPEEPDVVGEIGSVFNDRVITSISRDYNYDY